jgi:hypothetical protein
VKEWDHLNLLEGLLENEAFVVMAEVNVALAADLEIVSEQQRVVFVMHYHILHIIEPQT